MSPQKVSFPESVRREMHEHIGSIRAHREGGHAEVDFRTFFDAYFFPSLARMKRLDRMWPGVLREFRKRVRRDESY